MIESGQQEQSLLYVFRQLDAGRRAIIFEFAVASVIELGSQRPIVPVSEGASGPQ